MLGLSTLVLNLKKRHRVVGHEKDAVAGLMLVVSPALAYDDGIFNARPDPNANYGTPQQQRIPAPDSFGGGIWAKTILQPTMEDAPAWLTAKPKKKPRMYRVICLKTVRRPQASARFEDLIDFVKRAK